MSENQKLAGALLRLGAGLQDGWEWRVRTTAHNTQRRSLAISRRKIHLFRVGTRRSLGKLEAPSQCLNVSRLDTEDMKTFSSTTSHVPPFCTLCMLYAVRKLKWGQ